MGKYREIVPAPQQSRYIECYWSREDSEGKTAHRVLPDGCVEDYGPHYTSFVDGRLSGGFTTDSGKPRNGVLVVLYSSDLSGVQKKIEEAGGKIVKPVFSFPAARGFISPIPVETSWPSGRTLRRRAFFLPTTHPAAVGAVCDRADFV